MKFFLRQLCFSASFTPYCHVSTKPFVPNNFPLNNVPEPLYLKETSAKKSLILGDKQRFVESLDYCAKIVEERDYENFLTLLLMPKTVRPTILSFLALNAEVSVVRQKIRRNSGVAGIYQLQFWRDALQVWGGRQKGLLPRQPSLMCLKTFGNAEDVDLLLNLVEARQVTLGDRPFKLLEDYETNSKLIYGSLIRLWANALLRQNGKYQANNFSKDFENVADLLAKSLGIAILLRGTLPLLREDVVLLPENIMSAHQLTPDLIYKNKNPKALSHLAEELCQVSRDYLNSARDFCKKIDVALRPALIGAAFRAEYLTTTLRADKFNLFSSRLQNRHPFTSWKLWWKFWRKSY